jgi:hypothetical protein
MDERLKIVKNITNITDGDGNTVQLTDAGLNIEFSQNKYASKKLAVWRILINGKCLTKSDKYKFEYNCVTCNSKHSLCPISLIRKVNKCSHECVECVNLNATKRANHSANFSTYAAKNAEAALEALTHLTYIQKRDACLAKFNALDDDYKTAYFACHLTSEDYSRISKNIVSFQNGKITDFENIEYWPVYNSTNQMTFTHIMYNTKTQTLFKPHQPIMHCDNCECTWRAKSIERFKNCHKIYCKTCSLCNTTFILRKTHNINNDVVMYQSQLELKFINWCNNSGFVINNGPIIPYEFNAKERTYRVDFVINSTLIETKDNHVWHRAELESGKWQAKESAARAQVSAGNYDDYMMITPTNWIESLKILKNKLKINNPRIKPEEQMIKQDIV